MFYGAHSTREGRNTSELTSLRTIDVLRQQTFRRISVVVVRLGLERQSLAVYGERRAVTTAGAIAAALGRRVCRCSRHLHLTTERTHRYSTTTFLQQPYTNAISIVRRSRNRYAVHQ